jgi:cell division protein FtsB
MAAKTRMRTPESDGAPPRRRRRRIVEAVLIFAACLFLIDALIGDNGWVASRRAREESAALERELAEAKAEQETLIEEARRLTSDQATLEDAARRDLGLIKPGEKIFRIRDVAPGATNP